MTVRGETSMLSKPAGRGLRAGASGRAGSLTSTCMPSDTTTMPRRLLALAVRALVVVSLLGLACEAMTVSDHTNNWAVLVCTSRFWCVTPLPSTPGLVACGRCLC
jgi:hypothetical protein